MDKLKSRKFWLALAGTILPIIASYLTGDVDLYESLRLSARCAPMGSVYRGGARRAGDGMPGRCTPQTSRKPVCAGPEAFGLSRQAPSRSQ
mgnify:CR=1 FL=1